MFCSGCGTANKDGALFCVHCGAALTRTVTVQVKNTVLVREKTSKMRRVFWTCGILAATVFILAIIAPIAICTIIGVSEDQESEALHILSSSMTVDTFGCAEVTGTVENAGDFEIAGHLISAKFYDSAGVLIDTQSDRIEDVAAGEKAQFSIRCLERGAVRYEVYVD